MAGDCNQPREMPPKGGLCRRMRPGWRGSGLAGPSAGAVRSRVGIRLHGCRSRGAPAGSCVGWQVVGAWPGAVWGRARIPPRGCRSRGAPTGSCVGWRVGPWAGGLIGTGSLMIAATRAGSMSALNRLSSAASAPSWLTPCSSLRTSAIRSGEPWDSNSRRLSRSAVRYGRTGGQSGCGSTARPAMLRLSARS